MAYAVVAFAIKGLSDLLIEEGKFLYGVKDQVEEMKAELKRMQCFLKDADAKEDGDERIRNWISEITDLAYRIGDLLETFAIQVVSKRERRRNKNILKRLACIFDEAITVHKVGWEIEAIKSKITNLTTSLQNHGVRSLNDGESSTSTNDKKKWLRMSYPHVIEQDFVGMETDMEHLLSRLTDNKNICEVVSIKGMGGQGKTTIATKLYNNTSVQSHFERFGWACITQQCQLKIGLQQILKGLVPEKTGEIMNMEVVDLVPQLHEVLLEKKCLIVIDDIWTKDDWEILKPAFPIGQTGGTKVLLTTRKLEVGFAHQLGCLTEEQGWNLLQLKAFRGRDETPDFRIDPGMEKLGRNIVRQCEGLPLAISVLGGILKGKSMAREWEMVNKDIESYLRRGDGIEEDQAGLMRVLGLSYIDLPYCLKHCFLYLARYPEDSSIQAEKLCKLWMAEGFISSDDIGVEETMMDVAERYLDELARRSMVQVELVNEDVFSEVKRFESCHLHDIMRDLCLFNAKKENFIDHIAVTGDDSSKFATYMSSSITKVRRFSVYLDENCDAYIAHEKHDITRHLRSLMLLNICEPRPPLKISGISKFKLMRVLELVGFDFMEKSIPKEIQELIHLRYLSLFDCWISELPSCIGKLQYLQTLDLRVRGRVGLPNVIWNLKRLKHLYLPLRFNLKNKDELLRLDGLFELEILYISMLELCDLVKLASLTNLRILNVYVESVIGVQNLINYLNTVPPQQLRSKLIVDIFFRYRADVITSVVPELFTCTSLNCLELNGSLRNLPKCDNYSFSPNLTSIQLYKSNLEEDPMIVLENIPNLRNLRMLYGVYTGNVMTCSSTGFPQLRNLELVNWHNLKEWNVNEGAMPKLHTLDIAICSNLEMVPEGLRFLQFLKKIVIAFMPEEFVRRVQVIDGQEGEDFYKIRHVNSITIHKIRPTTTRPSDSSCS